MCFIYSPQFLYTFIKFPKGKPYFRFEFRDIITARKYRVGNDKCMPTRNIIAYLVPIAFLIALIPVINSE
jgi:hypothetical protein